MINGGIEFKTFSFPNCVLRFGTKKYRSIQIYSEPGAQMNINLVIIYIYGENIEVCYHRNSGGLLPEFIEPVRYGVFIVAEFKLDSYQRDH